MSHQSSVYIWDQQQLYDINHQTLLRRHGCSSCICNPTAACISLRKAVGAFHSPTCITGRVQWLGVSCSWAWEHVMGLSQAGLGVSWGDGGQCPTVVTACEVHCHLPFSPDCMKGFHASLIQLLSPNPTLFPKPFCNSLDTIELVCFCLIF